MADFQFGRRVTRAGLSSGLVVSAVVFAVVSWWSNVRAADESPTSTGVLVGPSNQTPAAAGPGNSTPANADRRPAAIDAPPAAPAPAAPPDAAPPDASSTMDEETIRDLDRIRRRVGRSPLAGSLLESAGSGKDPKSLGDSEFARQLRDRFGLPRARGPYSTPAPSQARGPRRGESDPPSGQEETMRRRYMESMMRRMEVLAEDLEAVDLVQDAEQIRTVRARLALEMGID